MHRRGAAPRYLDELGPFLVVVTVGPDAQVEPIAQPQRGELDLGEHADVAREHGLVHPPARESRQGGGRARQGSSPRCECGLHRRRLRGQVRDEPVDVPARLRHPGQGERLQDDRAVGAPRHRRHYLKRAPEHPQEHRGVQLGADPVGAEQGAVDVPQHEEVARRPPRCLPHEAYRKSAGAWVRSPRFKSAGVWGARGAMGGGQPPMRGSQPPI